MSRELDRLRKQVQAMGLRPLALKAPRYPELAGQQKLLHAESEFVALPADLDLGAQILDPADPNFGKFYYLVDYDPVGSGPVL